jgi:hypothetical protein
MTERSSPGASARPDWLTLSDDLEAVFVAARRLSTMTRLQAAEYDRLRAVADPRRLREAWSDTIHFFAKVVTDLDHAVERLSAQAAAILGLALDASEKEG